MQIFVVNLEGKTITLDVETGDTILDVKNKFLNKEKMNDDPKKYKFIYAGKLLDNAKTLEELKISKEATIHVIYKIGGTPDPKTYPKQGLTGTLTNDTIKDLVLRVLDTDINEKTLVMIPGCVLGTKRIQIESMVHPESKYYESHDLFKQQLPLPILEEAYNTNKNVHIFLMDPEFVNKGRDDSVRVIFNRIQQKYEGDFSDESSDGKMEFYIEEIYDIFEEIELHKPKKKYSSHVIVYILPYTITEGELRDIAGSVYDIEHFIYLKPNPHGDLENDNFLTNSRIENTLKMWHSSGTLFGGKTPKHYTAGLSRKDKKKQQRYLKKSSKDYDKGKYTTRPKLKSFKSKKSNWTTKFKKKYGEDVKTYRQISKATGIPSGALKAVVKKGMGAYYSSGSRPNQTAESWGKARMYSYIMGGPTRKIDHHITEEYNVKF